MNRFAVVYAISQNKTVGKLPELLVFYLNFSNGDESNVSGRGCFEIADSSDVFT